METVATRINEYGSYADRSDRRACVVGLGYVGLPLAQRMREVGWNVTGYDISVSKTIQVNKAESTLRHVSGSGRLHATSEILEASDCTVFVIAVPTPTDTQLRPDLDPLREATKSIGTVLKRGDLVIVESTVYPSVTRNVCAPILEEASGLSHLTDFHLGYSPERINPGDNHHKLETSSKVISGATEETAKLVHSFYADLLDAPLHLVSSLEVAEMTKLVENAQRDVNIAFINEVARISNAMRIDTDELLQACKSKWNFLPFAPGLVGGHCIAVDPHYLVAIAKEHDVDARLVRTARDTNEGHAQYLCDRILQTCKDNSIVPAKTHAVIVGATYKPNVADTRNSGPYALSARLAAHLATVAMFDPLLQKSDHSETELDAASCDLVIIAVLHDDLAADMVATAERVLKPNGLLIDLTGLAGLQGSRNALTLI